MSSATGAAGHPKRPPFMAVLGLLPPYSLEDVREAYRQKALTAHPDRGGNAAEFNQLSEAYDRAIEYVNFHGDRRAWIATQVECHLLQEEVAAEVRRRKGQVEFEGMDWVKESWGDGFEVLANRLRSIRAQGLSDGDDFLAYLAAKQLPFLTELDVAGSRVTDAGLAQLVRCTLLQSLNLSGTAVTYAGVRAVLTELSSLGRLSIQNTRIGWLRRRLLQRSFPRLHIVSK